MLLNTLVQLLLAARIRLRADATPVRAPPNPLAMLMGGGGAAAPSQTAAEYDEQQLGSLRTSYRLGCLVTCFLHFKLGLVQPLLAQARDPLGLGRAVLLRGARALERLLGL